MNGIIYCRVSSKEQTEGTSLESQEVACREYARNKNIRVLKIFVEQGESAKFADRTQLLELIDFCRKNKGKVQTLIVWKIDRFARNVADHFNIKATLLKYGVRIVSVTEPIDANPEGKLMETILAGFAEFDNEIRAIRSVQGMRRKIQNGIFPWKAPLGYKSSTINGEKKNEPDQPDQPLFGLLQKAWQEFATGAYTKAEMLRLMTGWGCITQKGKPMTAQSLDSFFKNRFYAGILTDPWSGQEYEGKHLPMVSHEKFALVQQVIQKRSQSVPHQKERPEFPLRGLVRCSHCLHYMTASFSRGYSRRYPYYHCNNRKCRNRGKSHPSGEIHDEFGLLLGWVVPKPEVVDIFGKEMLKVAEKQQTFLKLKKSRTEAELARVSRQIQELIRLRTDALITDREFIEQRSLLSRRRIALESMPLGDGLKREQVRALIQELRHPVTQIAEVWKHFSLPLQRQFSRLILPVGFIHGKSRTPELGLLFKLFEDFSEGKTNGVRPVRFERTTVSLKGSCSTN